MTKVLDQTADTNFTSFYRYAMQYDLPDFVKNASAEDTGLPTTTANISESCPVSQYADVRSPNQFPFFTKAATYVSWLYFLNNRDKIASKIASRIESRLTKAAEYWEISNEVRRLKENHNKSASVEEYPDEMYALVYSLDGVKHRALPVRNTEEVKVAAEWFVKERDYYDFTYRQEIAERIIKRANDLGADLGDCDDELQRQAGLGFCTNKQAADLIRSRLYQTGVDSQTRESLTKLASSVEHSPEFALDVNALRNLAKTVDQFDRQFNVKYSQVRPRPEDVLFQVTFKQASAIADNSCQSVIGTVYDQRDFEKLSVGTFQSLFGDELTKEVSVGLKIDPQKMAEVLYTLPRPDAEMFDDMMQEAGIRPVGKQAAACTYNYSPEDMAKIASFYKG